MKSIVETKKSTRGRPPVDTEAVNLRLPREVLEAVEAYRREQETIPSRPEAIRQALTDWLQQRGYLQKPVETGKRPNGLNAGNDD